MLQTIPARARRLKDTASVAVVDKNIELELKVICAIIIYFQQNQALL